jgi:hypothetical protein
MGMGGMLAQMTNFVNINVVTLFWVLLVSR